MSREPLLAMMHSLRAGFPSFPLLLIVSPFGEETSPPQLQGI
jgi:hypothetical protein